MPKVILKYKKMTPSAMAPHQAHPDDTGFDLYADQTVYFAPFETKRISLGISIQLTKGYSAEVRPRSGMSLRTPLKCILGTVDPGYRGEIMAIFVNLSNRPNQINKGDKVCQLVIRRDVSVQSIECDKLNDSGRGSDGFGSTGRN